MIKGEFSYLLSETDFSGEQVAEVLAASEDLVSSQIARAEKGLVGLDAFLAPKYSLRANRTQLSVSLDIDVQRRDADAWDTIEAELEFMRRSLYGRLSPESSTLLEASVAGQSIYGMHTYDIARIAPNQSNAIAIQTLSLQDLTDGGHRDPRGLANPRNLEKLVIQKERLERNPLDYLGTFRGDVLVGFIKTHEWLLGDQLDFGKFTERRKLRKEYKAGVRTFEDHPLGILGLVTDKAVANYQDRQRMIDDLLAYALFEAKSSDLARRVVIPIHDKDEVAPALIRANFDPMRLDGKSYGMHQQLFEHAVAA